MLSRVSPAVNPVPATAVLEGGDGVLAFNHVRTQEMRTQSIGARTSSARGRSSGVYEVTPELAIRGMKVRGELRGRAVARSIVGFSGNILWLPCVCSER